MITANGCLASQIGRCYNRGILLADGWMMFIYFLRGSLTIAMENYCLLMLSGAIVLLALFFFLRFFSRSNNIWS